MIMNNGWVPVSSWYPFGAKGINSFITISSDSNELQLNAHFDLEKKDSTNHWEQHAPHNANIYVNTKIARDFYKKRLDFSFPSDYVSILTFASDVSYFTKITIPTIVIDKQATQSAITDRYPYRQNAEFHEFSHYIYSLVHGGIVDPCNNVRNHYGFYNNCSSDSVAEGFAEFMGQLIFNEEIMLPKGKAKDSIYCGTERSGAYFDLERNYYIDELDRSGFVDRDAEEQSFASILWDLYDGKNANDNENLELDINEIWKIITDAYQQPNYYVLGLYRFYPSYEDLIRFKMESTTFDELMERIHNASYIYVGGGTTHRPVELIPDLYYILYYKYNNIDAMFKVRRIFLDNAGEHDFEKPYITSFNEGDVIGMPSPNDPYIYEAVKTHDPDRLERLFKIRGRADFQFDSSSIVTVKSIKENLPYNATIHVKVQEPYDYLSFNLSVLITEEEQEVYIDLPPARYNSTYFITSDKEGYKPVQFFNLSSSDYWSTNQSFNAEAPKLESTSIFGDQGLLIFIIIFVVVIVAGVILYIAKKKKNTSGFYNAVNS